MTTEINKIPTQNAFLLALCELRKGQTVSQLSEELAELIGEVRRTGKKGSLHLKLTIDPTSEDTVSVDLDSDLKTPKMNVAPTTFFMTDDNRLTRKDPKQQEMPFEALENPSGKMAAANDRKEA